MVDVEGHRLRNAWQFRPNRQHPGRNNGLHLGPCEEGTRRGGGNPQHRAENKYHHAG